MSSPIVCQTPLEAVAEIKSHESVWLHGMGATPHVLVGALAEHAQKLEGLRLFHLHTEGIEPLCHKSLKGKVFHHCYFLDSSTRRLVKEGMADYAPTFLSEVPKLFRQNEQSLDTAIVQVSPPDAHGVCTLGISVEATKAACEQAKRIIAVINPNMPRTHGDGFIHYDEFDRVYHDDSPITETPHDDHLSDVSLQIGRNVADLIDNGACLQMGIGAIPNAVLASLTHHKDLGIHTEMFSDGVLPLVESGVINNRRKKVHPGKIVTGFVLGSRTLYDFVDDNPEVVFLDIEYVNDTSIIRRNPKVVAINSAIQVDVSGQVSADSIGTRLYSGFGGQMDFVRGAALSKNGAAVIALPSTASGGKVSRIVPVLALGAGVVTTRAHVHYVVTEYGVANLRGKTIGQRARALIDIAHPDFREALCKESYDRWRVAI